MAYIVVQVQMHLSYADLSNIDQDDGDLQEQKWS